MLSALLTAVGRKRFVPAKGWKVLTGKDKPSFNKGKQAMKAGFLDQHGRFHKVPSMQPDYRVPDLTQFKLKPYVARKPDTIDGAQP